MKKINILTLVGMVVFALSSLLVYAHGTGMEMSGSTTMMKTRMMKMMDLMHDQMDGNQAFDCEKVSDIEMMKKGEGMMEEMMGHEDHERIEKVMEVDMQDHDSMHMMMGMWSSGCVGDENMNTMMGRYSVPGHLDNGYQGPIQVNWSSVFLGIVIGAVSAWAGSRLVKKKVAN